MDKPNHSSRGSGANGSGRRRGRGRRPQRWRGGRGNRHSPPLRAALEPDVVNAATRGQPQRRQFNQVLLHRRSNPSRPQFTNPPTNHGTITQDPRSLPEDHPLIVEMKGLTEEKARRQLYWAELAKILGGEWENPASFDRQTWLEETRVADEKLDELAGQIRLAEHGVYAPPPPRSFNRPSVYSTLSESAVREQWGTEHKIVDETVDETGKKTSSAVHNQMTSTDMPNTVSSTIATARGPRRPQRPLFIHDSDIEDDEDENSQNPQNNYQTNDSLVKATRGRRASRAARSRKSRSHDQIPAHEANTAQIDAAEPGIVRKGAAGSGMVGTSAAEPGVVRTSVAGPNLVGSNTAEPSIFQPTVSEQRLAVPFIDLSNSTSTSTESLNIARSSAVPPDAEKPLTVESASVSEDSVPAEDGANQDWIQTIIRKWEQKRNRIDPLLSDYTTTESSLQASSRQRPSSSLGAFTASTNTQQALAAVVVSNLIQQDFTRNIRQNASSSTLKPDLVQKTTKRRHESEQEGPVKKLRKSARPESEEQNNDGQGLRVVQRNQQPGYLHIDDTSPIEVVDLHSVISSEHETNRPNEVQQARFRRSVVHRRARDSDDDSFSDSDDDSFSDPDDDSFSRAPRRRRVMWGEDEGHSPVDEEGHSPVDDADWALPTPTRDPIIYDQTPPNSRTVRVGNLAFAVDESDIWDLFPGLDIDSITIPVDRINNRNHGVAFVVFASMVDADYAVDDNDGQTIRGRLVTICRGRLPATMPTANSGDCESSPTPSTISSDERSQIGHELIPRDPSYRVLTDKGKNARENNGPRDLDEEVKEKATFWGPLSLLNLTKKDRQEKRLLLEKYSREIPEYKAKKQQGQQIEGYQWALVNREEDVGDMLKDLDWLDEESEKEKNGRGKGRGRGRGRGRGKK